MNYFNYDFLKDDAFEFRGEIPSIEFLISIV